MNIPHKISLACLLQLCFATALFAVTNDKFVIGVDAGPGLSVLYNKPYSYYGGLVNSHKISPAASVGINFQYNISKLFSIRTGAYYNWLPVKQVNIYAWLDDSPVNSALNNHNVNYITVPILFRATFGKKVKFFVETGPYISMLIKPAEGYSYVGQPITLQPFCGDIGATLDAGITVPLPHRFALSFEVRNNIGLTNVFSNFKTYSSVLLSGFTYTFGKNIHAEKK